MARSAPPDADGTRARLRALSGRGDAWGGREDVEVGEPAGPAERVGWPGAAPGTPAARLRLPRVAVVPGAGARSARAGAWREEADPGPAGDRAGPARPGAWRGQPDLPDGDARCSAPDLPRGDARSSTPDPWWDDDEDDPPASRGSAWDPPARGERVRRWAERWLPGSWVGARWDPGRTGALALATVAAVAAVVAAVGVWSDRPVPEPVPALPVVAGAPPAPSLPSASGAPPLPAEGPIVVSVSGKVERPGLVRIPPGSRVGDAIDAAGGATPEADLTGLNLAARIGDGEQVVVGVPTPVTPPAGAGGAGAGAGGAGSAAAPAGGASGGAPGGRLDLNAATLEQLDQLPGVGPVTAQRILEWRTQNGRFGAIEQLQEVSGIGDARFANLRDLVTV
ncbi:helix-hairpin-helix domain-containing protein [Actinomycetospora straminea]|uniref:Helix-hairpin-helix DNA-binding motif class 1 domain-containing protein n=1 Tax=Actinomycetospora straminea TaxID=663607 RepID=A0ABP9EQ24_9PSEU|nr:helix-hairpin-helix domain-containing protein [Actinomycetospora straminea]MDD7933503.1 helix-hairpin-helix domain-containing protein [Actinomycetospora straminea]